MSSLFLILAACSLYGSVWSSGCPQKPVISAFLDTASDFIAKAKNTLSDCDAWDEYGHLDNIPVDCAHHYNLGRTTSGLYVIKPNSNVLNGKAFKVYCDMDTDGGGWIVIQRRGNYGNDLKYFYKDWNSYKEGFGNLEEEFWLGNDRIHAITGQGTYSARFDLVALDGEKANEIVDNFSLGDENSNYTLHVAVPDGTAGDSITYNDGMQFTTKDRDNDKNPDGNCARIDHGAWWYVNTNCTQSNLNGFNYQSTHPNADDGIDWQTFRGPYESLKTAEIKVRPLKHPKK